jgi:hypothetical protein
LISTSSEKKLLMSWWEIPKERDHSDDLGIDGWDQNGSWGNWLVGGCRVGYSEKKIYLRIFLN